MAMNIGHYMGVSVTSTYAGLTGWTVSPLNPAISLAEISFTFF